MRSYRTWKFGLRAASNSIALHWVGKVEHYCYTTLEMEIYGFKPQIGIAFATATLLDGTGDFILSLASMGLYTH
jgi:hypothetical protein